MAYNRLDPHKYFNRYMEAKSISSFPKSVENEIKLLSFDPKMLANAFGSFTIRVQKYPGDIDLVDEWIPPTGKKFTRNQVVRMFHNSLQRIVRSIVDSRQHYYSEIKLGLDLRYDIDIGQCVNGKYTVSKNLLSDSIRLLNEGLLSNSELVKIELVWKHRKNADEDFYDIIHDLFRQHRILRWTSDEILIGIKHLPQNESITLDEAINIDTIAKVDEIAIIGGRFVEITNIFWLHYNDGTEIKAIETQADPEISLKDEIEKLYYSDMYYNPFKCIKRMFAYGRTNKKEHQRLLEILLPFISSNTSQMYQIKSELDTIVLLLDKFQNPSPITIQNQIDFTKERLSTIIEFRPEVIEIFNSLINDFENASTKYRKIDILKDIMKILSAHINFETITFMNRAGINPPSKIIDFYMDRVYKEKIRTPIEDPHAAIDDLLNQI